MKFLRAAALAICLTPSLAVAQNAPATLGYHVVYGRIGATPGDTGPGQQVPFATLSANLFGTKSANTVYAGPVSGTADLPAFRALVGADLPLPTASTLGGIESIAAVAHQWISTISTSGVPTLSQPAYSDISGSSITWANSAAPASPAAGNVTFWTDSTDLRLHDKNAAGAIGTTAVALAPVAGTYVTGMSAAGVLSTGTPVSSVTPGGGLVSSTTANCSQSAITASGTVSRGDCINAQTGSSYAIADSDRGKIITATNAGAQAYSIAAASAASNFFAGWTTFIENNSTNVAGVVTITATTSTLCAQGTCAATYKIQPGQFARITSDGTNYQITENTVGSQVPGTTTNDNACAGCVGEDLIQSIAGGSAISLTTATNANIATITLTAGDWDVWITPNFTGTTTAATLLRASISTTTATENVTAGKFVAAGSGTFAVSDLGLGSLLARFQVATSQQVWLVVRCTFGSGTCLGYGNIEARRRR